MKHNLANHYSVVLLLDGQPAEHVLMLERAAWKEFAPNQWTGIGGKYQAGDTLLSGALRELLEETGLDLPIEEFARCIVNDSRKTLHYFWGLLDPVSTPTCTEGALHWVTKTELLDRTIIGTTRTVIEEWLHRYLRTDRPFTIELERQDPDRPEQVPTSVRIVEGLATD